MTGSSDHDWWLMKGHNCMLSTLPLQHFTDFSHQRLHSRSSHRTRRHRAVSQNPASHSLSEYDTSLSDSASGSRDVLAPVWAVFRWAYCLRALWRLKANSQRTRTFVHLLASGQTCNLYHTLWHIRSRLRDSFARLTILVFLASFPQVGLHQLMPDLCRTWALVHYNAWGRFLDTHCHSAHS